ncbi:MAG: hypothetical protein ACREM1_02965 [Longimicrobiales bacterium]
MATRMTPDTAPLIVVGSGRAKPAFGSAGYRGHVTRALIAAATIVVAVAALRLGVVWVFERQPGPAAQLVALAGMVDVLPWLVVAFALYYAALYAGQSTSLLAYRTLGMGMILIALFGAGLAVLAISRYGWLPPDLDPETAQRLRARVIWTVGICALHVVVLIPIGMLGLRRPVVR